MTPTREELIALCLRTLDDVCKATTQSVEHAIVTTERCTLATELLKRLVEPAKPDSPQDRMAKALDDIHQIFSADYLKAARLVCEAYELLYGHYEVSSDQLREIREFAEAHRKSDEAWDSGALGQSAEHAKAVDMELTKGIALEKFGCYVWVDDGALLYCPMTPNGLPDTDENGIWNWGEVTAPQSQEFLDEVNVCFATAFKMDGFPGR